ncbi:YncE family protein [Thalassotalea fusca]
MADDIAVSADKMELYTVDQINRKLNVIDIKESSPTFHQVIASVSSLPFQPTNLVLVEQFALVASNGGRALSIIDLDKRQVVKEIDTGMYNLNISSFSEGNLVYLSAFYAGKVNVFEVDGEPQSSSFGNIINTVYEGSNGAFHVKRYGEFLFVSTFTGTEVISLNSGELVKVVCNDVTNIELSPNNQYLYCLSKDEANNTLVNIYLVGSFDLINQQMIGNDKLSFVHLNLDSDRLLVSGAANNAYLFEVNDDESLSPISSLIFADDFNPKTAENNSTSKITITGDNFPNTVTARIESEDSSCINVYYSSTSVEFDCDFSSVGEKRLELRAHPEDESFIENSGDWYIDVQPVPVSPVVYDFTPKTFKKSEFALITVTGSDLLATSEARIDGENEACKLVSYASNKVEFDCISKLAGQKRFYLKSHSDDELYINGSSNWFVMVEDTMLNEDTLTNENSIEETKGGGVALFSILMLFLVFNCRAIISFPL